MKVPDGLIATEYVVAVQLYAHRDPASFSGRDVRFVRMVSPFYPEERWAVRSHVDCLSRSGEWEWEPSPSSRDDEFYARCRFDSLEQAHTAWMEAKNMSDEGSDGCPQG